MVTTSKERRQTPDQKRAAHAWELIQRAERAADKRDFGTEVKKLPMRIVASGLGQALSFLEAKAKDKKPGVRALADGLSAFIRERIPPKPGEPTSLLERIVHGEASFLRRATDESLAYLQWVGRFAEAKGLVGEEE